MVFPEKITPCPIIETVFELRFKSSINSNAVFGIIYSALQAQFPKVETLPILQIPEAIRKNDPNLRYKPSYKISNDNYIVQIGDEVIAISSNVNYPGWKNYSEVLLNVLTSLHKIKVIQNIERVGLRYINFFENINIFDNVNIKLNMYQKEISNKNTFIRTEEHGAIFVGTIQVANNISVKNKVGSLIDIDVYNDNNKNKLDNFFSTKKEFIDKAHLFEKKLFYDLLTEDFLKSLNPVYNVE